MPSWRILVLFLLVPVVGRPHPQFDSSSIVNAASFVPVEVEGGSIARGSIFTIFGTDMGPPEGVRATSFPLQKELGGVSVQVRQGLTTVDALPLFANQKQLNAIMPSDAPLGDVEIIANYVGGIIRPNSIPVAGRVVESSVGIFMLAAAGSSGPAVIQNFISPAEQPLNSTLETAQPGQFVTLWATGLGGIDAPDNVAPPVGDLAVPVDVYIGGRSANLLYGGRTSCCAGVDQFVFQVPQEAPLGCFVPVFVRVNNSISSNAGTISISEVGGPCDDPLNPFLSRGVAPGSRSMTVGTIALNRLAVDFGDGQTSVQDEAVASFGTITDRTRFLDTAVVTPAMGSCLTQTLRNESRLLPLPVPPIPRNAGQVLSLRGPGGVRDIPRTTPGVFSGLLGSETGPAFLEPGVFTVQSTGGSDIGAFEATVTMRPPLNWTNREEMAKVDRQAGVTVTWSGGDPSEEYVTILGLSSTSLDPNNNVRGLFVCAVPIEDQSFSVGPEVMGNLPASISRGAGSTGFLFVGTSLFPKKLEASGLDYGVVTYKNLIGKTVDYE